MLGVLTMSSGGSNTPHARLIAPLSLEMESAGQQALIAGDLNLAAGFYESAIAADPRNSRAYVALGDIARQRDMPGQAIRLYRAALGADPANRDALAGQGAAYVARGAIARARRNLSKLQSLCSGECAQVAALTSALNAAGERTAMRVEDVMPRPVVAPMEPSKP